MRYIYKNKQTKEEKTIGCHQNFLKWMAQNKDKLDRYEIWKIRTGQKIRIR